LGCLTYVLTLEKTRVANKKLEPYAELNILVGYKGNYIYRVYVLSRKRNKIIYLSNCKFNKRRVYTNKYIYLYKGNNKKIKWILPTKDTRVMRNKRNSNRVKFDSLDFTRPIGELIPCY
jgi:hypothetical protein